MTADRVPTLLVRVTMPDDGRSWFLPLKCIPHKDVRELFYPGAMCVDRQCQVECRRNEVTFHECEDHDLVLVPEVQT